MNSSSDQSSIGLKIIIIGNSSTGKTSIINKYIYNKFSKSIKATIISQFDFKIVKYNDQMYRLQFWDLAGQDRSPEMTKLFCQDSNGVIICCEVNNDESRKDTLKWRENLINNRIDVNLIPIILCENKSDLLNNDMDNFQDLEFFSNNNQFTKCFRTSALSGFGIENMIKFILGEIIKRLQNEENNDFLENMNDGSFQLKNKKNTNQNQGKKCC